MESVVLYVYAWLVVQGMFLKMKEKYPIWRMNYIDHSLQNKAMETESLRISAKRTEHFS